MISKPKIPYVHRIYMVLANPTPVLYMVTVTCTPTVMSRVGQNRIYIRRIPPYIW